MTPTNYIRARASPHSRYWQLGERKEVMAHIKNETFGDLLDCPPSGFSALPLNAVYRNKFTVMAKWHRVRYRRSLGK